jgi:hypothetical protein
MNDRKQLDRPNLCDACEKRPPVYALANEWNDGAISLEFELCKECFVTRRERVHNII